MALATDTSGEARAQELQHWLETQKFVAGRVPQRVEIRREVDADERPAWFFVVTLDDPPEDQGTWPLDTTMELRRNVWDKALELGLPWPWYIRLRPEHDDPVDDDDGLELGR
jgi:hypothetical protein